MNCRTYLKTVLIMEILFRYLLMYEYSFIITIANAMKSFQIKSNHFVIKLKSKRNIYLFIYEFTNRTATICTGFAK